MLDIHEVMEDLHPPPMLDEYGERPRKRRRLVGPPIHMPSFLVETVLEWKVEGEIKTATALLLLDSGATGPVLASHFIKKHKIPLERKLHKVQMLAANGGQIEGGTHHTTSLGVWIGNHVSDMKFEALGIPDEGSRNLVGYLPMSWLTIHNPDIDWQLGKIKWRSDYCQRHCLPSTVKLEWITEEQMLREPKDQVHVFGLAVYHDEDGGDISARLVDYYKDYADIFSEEKIHALPEHSKYDHKIELEPGTTPPFGPIYPLSESELRVLRKYLDEMLASGKIQRSTSPAAAPILFVPKPDGTLRLCIDYRGLNKITIKNRYPLPLMNELRDRLGKARFFTKLDLKNGFYLLRIAKGDEWKTAFRCRYGLYEYTVMPFGLCNAPSTFQSMINDVFHDLLDEGVVVYLDDILIYSEDEDSHINLVRRVMERIRVAKLCCSIKKSVIHAREVEFLGYHISPEGISMSIAKVESVRNWPVPRNVKDIQAFLGFANFYRRFIEGFSKVCKPLTDLTQKDRVFEWTPQCEEAFQRLKTLFTEGPILAHFDHTRFTRVETDASDFALGAILSQLCEDNKWHPIAFHSRKFQPAEVNYDVHDKEMTAIVVAFKEWEHLLMSVKHEVTIFTDHKNLEYFNTTKVLNRRQHRWAEFLQPFNFKVVYREGRLNEKADTLSRRRDYRPEEGGEPLAVPQKFFGPGQYEQVPVDGHVLLTQQRLRKMTSLTLADTFSDKIRAAGAADPAYVALQKAIEGKKKVKLDVDFVDGLLYVKGRWYIPDSRELKHTIFKAEHDSRVAGHFGQFKTLERIKANFWWPGMAQDVEEYVRSCDACQRNKSTRHKKYGLLDPLEIPNRPWDDISMDFIVGLPASGGHTKIWVVVDRFSKMAHFIPLSTDTPIKEIANIFLREIWRLHGLPSSVISDRDSRFQSKFWLEVMDALKVDVRLSTAFHPQTDGQTERVNQILEQYLRCYCSYQQDDWAELLPLAEHAYNSAVSESTKISPFEANYGFSPQTNWLERPKRKRQNPGSEEVYEGWTSVWQIMRENLDRAQARQRKWYDQKRQPAPEYNTLEDVKEGRAKVADKVMLSRQNIKTKRPTEKLDHKYFGPFVVKRKIGQRAYELELPARMKIHPVFYVGLLEPYRESTDPERKQDPPLPDEVDNELSFVVDKIVDSRWFGPAKGKFPARFVQYMVVWAGYGPEENSWEPYEVLEGTAEKALQDYHSKYPRRPRDHRVKV